MTQDTTTSSVTMCLCTKPSNESSIFVAVGGADCGNVFSMTMNFFPLVVYSQNVMILSKHSSSNLDLLQEATTDEVIHTYAGQLHAIMRVSCMSLSLSLLCTALAKEAYVGVNV